MKLGMPSLGLGGGGVVTGQASGTTL